MQIHQLLQNLIGNALKFHKPGVPPRVRVYGCHGERDGYCRFTVEDSGIGFDEKHAERIFGLFQRLHTREAYEGTGIGLTICRKIVERHGGRIEAQGRPGQGAAFTVELPLRQTGAEGEGMRHESPESISAIVDG